MTKQQLVNKAVENWQQLGLPDPTDNKSEFIRAMVAEGMLPADQPVPSATRMVRNAIRACSPPNGWYSLVSTFDAEIQELERLAELGSDWETRNAALQAAIADFKPLPTAAPEPPSERLLVLPLTDLHIGAPGTEEWPAELATFIQSLPADAAVLPVFNGDIFHVDTPSFTTTKGTPQDRMVVEPFDLIRGSYSAVLRTLERLRQRFVHVPEVVVTHGNHDHMACLHLLAALEALDYPVDAQGGEHLKHHVWNDELLLFEHGDGGRGKAENLLLAAVQRHRAQFAATKRTTLYTGHLHHAKQVDLAGVQHFQLPSPEAHSRWARKNAYEGQRGFQAFEYEADRGLVRTHWRMFR